MRITLPTFLLLLALLTSNLCHASDPTKNYELLSIWQKSAQYLIHMDVNAQSPGEEIIAIYPNQLDVLTSTSLTHQKSIIIPADKPYDIMPLHGESPDSLWLLFRYQTPITATFDLYLHNGDSLLLIKENCLYFTRKDRDRDGKFHQSIFPIAMFNDQNRNNRVLLHVNSGGDTGTRGLIAIDPYSGIEAWRYLAGPQICYSRLLTLKMMDCMRLYLAAMRPIIK